MYSFVNKDASKRAILASFVYRPLDNHGLLDTNVVRMTPVSVNFIDTMALESRQAGRTVPAFEAGMIRNGPLSAGLALERRTKFVWWEVGR